MRKGITEAKNGSTIFNVLALENLISKGYKFVQIKGLTLDMHYDYVEPHYLLLVPFRELPTDPLKKDIYEPLNSELLYKWATEKNEYPEIIIAKYAKD
ncbi:MAG: hypothetical protein KBF74_00890 [Ferruginibacter sp.]|nr:hypothetical protein [Ferruginibacter sp.]